MPNLTVNSLSITPGGEWPLDSSNGIMAARDNANYDVEKDRVEVAYQPSLPTSSSSQTWSGSVTIQTDFSP